MGSRYNDAINSKYIKDEKTSPKLEPSDKQKKLETLREEHGFGKLTIEKIQRFFPENDHEAVINHLNRNIQYLNETRKETQETSFTPLTVGEALEIREQQKSEIGNNQIYQSYIEGASSSMSSGGMCQEIQSLTSDTPLANIQQEIPTSSKDVLNTQELKLSFKELSVKIGYKINGLKRVRGDKNEINRLIKILDTMQNYAKNKDKKGILENWQKFKKEEVKDFAVQIHTNGTIREMDDIITASLIDSASEEQ